MTMNQEVKSTRADASDVAYKRQIAAAEHAAGIRPKHRAERVEMTADASPVRPLFDRIELAHYLEGKGITGPRLVHVIVPFSRAVAEAYVLAHGERPQRVAVWVPHVGPRNVYYYQGPGDRQLIDDVFHSTFTPELELRSEQ